MARVRVFSSCFSSKNSSMLAFTSSSLVNLTIESSVSFKLKNFDLRFESNWEILFCFIFKLFRIIVYHWVLRDLSI